MQEKPFELAKKHSTADLVFVLLIVLLICGGNGFSLVLGVLLRKITGLLWPAVLAVVGITVLAFSLAMLLVALRHRELAEQARKNPPQEPVAQKGSEYL